jgi:hypothetical protein
MQAGPQVVHWDGLDSRRNPVATGVYFFDLNHSGRAVARHKAIRLR